MLGKEKIFLLGSGQHARVVYYNAVEQGKYEIVGILDRSEKVGVFFQGIPIIGTEDFPLSKAIGTYGTNKFFIGFGDMSRRKGVFEKMIEGGWEAVNIIHPNAVVSKDAKLGKGILIECGCLITPNPIIGDNVVVNTGSQVNHDNIIENHVYIASGVVLSGGVRIEENTLIDDGVIITLGRKVGKNCIIGAGSVVTKDIDHNKIAYGNPCKVVRER